MQQAFEAAESGEQGPNLPNLHFSLKPGETVSLRLSTKVTQICLLCLCFLSMVMLITAEPLSYWIGLL